MMVGTTSSLDYDLWAFSHASPTHSTVEMQLYRNDHHEAIPETWNKLAAAIKQNPYLSKVQLDIGTVSDQESVRFMVSSLASLPALKTLHLRTLQNHHNAQTLQALHIATAVAQSSNSLRDVHVQGLWFANTTSTESFCQLIEDERNIQEWTWSNIECASPDLESKIARSWSKNSSWKAWKISGRIPHLWLQAAKVGCQATQQPMLRSLALECVSTQNLWQIVGEILQTGGSWCLQVRAMNLDEYAWRALLTCPQLSRVSFAHCCIGATFRLACLSKVVSSMEFIWNRLEDERQFVELLNRAYQTPKELQCPRQRIVLHHHWCQINDWELSTPTNLAAMLAPVVQWKGTRWPVQVVQRLEFFQFLRECWCNRENFAEKISQHALGSSVLFHALREDPAMLQNSAWSDTHLVAAN